MSKCELSILTDASRVYLPGETLRGTVAVQVNAPCCCDGLTITLRWRTHGRGNKAEGTPVTRTLFTGDWLPGTEERYPFELTLPNGPATYHGNLLNVDWYLTARADIPWAIDPKAETEVLLAPGQTPDYNYGPDYKSPEPPAIGTHQTQKATLIGAAVFVVFGLVLLGSTAFSLPPLIEVDSQWFQILAGGFCVVGGACFFLNALWPRISQQKLGVPDVQLSSFLVAPGENLNLSIELSPRSMISLTGVSAELIAREVVVSGSGTSETTHRHDLYQRKYILDPEGRRLEPGETVVMKEEVAIPSDAQPNFAAPDNKLEWLIKVHIGVVGWPDWSREYPITVHP